MKIAVAGTGYVGLVTAAVLANVGHEVICADVDRSKIERLKAGDCVIFEPGLSELIQANASRLSFTTDCASAYGDAEAIFIAVGTPEKADGSANLAYVYAVAGEIAAAVRRDCVVVIKSTVPIGTNDKVQQFIDRRLSGGIRVEVVSNPEFLSQGTAVKDMQQASRIVVGTESEQARAVIARLYGPMNLPILNTNRCSAEMIKYASNDFLALKISYINEIANLCEVLGADIEDVAAGMGMDPRIGSRFLKAGIGYGGSCFPKDTKALHWLSSYMDNEIKTVKAAVEVNANQKIKLIKKARKYFDSFNDLDIAILGLAFKPETDDLREAPSLANVSIILEDGARVRAWDPVAADNFRRHFPTGLTYCDTIEETLRDADLCFIFTEWPAVVGLDPAVFLTMRHPIILDGRNCYSLEKMRQHPLIYDSIGRQTVNNLQAD